MSSRFAETLVGLGGDVAVDRVATPLFGVQTLAGEFRTDPVRLGAFLVDLVDRDQDRHVGRPGVIDRFPGLGHDPVVGRDHDTATSVTWAPRARIAVKAS